MLSIIGKNVHVEFPIYDPRLRSLKYSFGIKHLAKGISRIAGDRNVGGQIGAGEAGRIVVKADRKSVV